VAGLSHYYVDYGAGNDAAGDGTIGTPYKTIQKALDVAVEDDGTQINIKAGTAQVLAASLDLTAFSATNGAPAFGDPLILRGYTSAANDGGIAEIDCNGATMWADNALDNIGLWGLKIHNGGNNNLVDLDASIFVHNCELYAGASTPTAKYLLDINTGIINNCYFHDTGDGAARAISAESALIIRCFIVLDDDATNAVAINKGYSENNIIVLRKVDQRGIDNPYSATGNIVYNTTAGTTPAIRHTSAVYAANQPIINNIIVGQSGAGGIGIFLSRVTFTGYNAFYNCATPISVTADFSGGLYTATNVALAADPFTDAANGDFSLTAAAKTALAAKGFPLAYLGAHANTVPNLNIGPIQMAASTGGGVNMPRVRVGH
jgi:hypothetical protein